MNKRYQNNQFRCDERGSVAMQFGFALVPMIMLMGGAVDVGRALHAHSTLQAAADAGALAAAASTTASSQQRSLLAAGMIDSNTSGSQMRNISREVSFAETTVTVTATAEVSTNFLTILRIDTIPIEVRAVAKSSYDPSTTSTDVGKICLLALDPNSADGIHAQGDNDIDYANCWGYTNSTQATALNANGNNATVVGEGHCAVGGYVAEHANFSPTPRTACQPVSDPFATVGAYSGGTYTPSFSPPVRPTTCTANNMDLKQGTFVIKPGRYCATNTAKPALNLQAKAKVQMLPGVYYFDGAINVQSGSSLTLKESGFSSTEASSVDGTGVLIYLAGTTSKMTIIGGGTITLKGRGTGSSYAGFLAIAAATANAGGQSNFQGGGTFNMEGIVYMPTQRIEVAGNGDINGTSNYFGMIAKDFYFRGNGKFYLRKKGPTSALPDILPDLPREVAQDAFLTQ